MQRILIIEDETSIAELQKDYFELNGFEVDVCHRGDEGLALALSEDYDLIVLDLMLPGMDGFDICRRVRSAKEVPLLLVSAKKEDIDKIRGFGAGADDYITKPFSPSELVARVKAHLARYARLIGTGDPRKNDIRIRNLRIQTASRKVYLGDREVLLKAKEFDLLAFFALHPNRVFSKDEIFERIWGLDSEADMATVAVHIRRIREKIEHDPSSPQYIETVWGAGYRLSV
ncbi:response regulator transcription factor [Paenibacillus filicis]|uniref:Response regulator transcription factor n=1 Tax=Paenibacillus gyeongsangnamensis TaxID=3388067 RepID=A0ABT4QCL1_9BACL|nr:response regulator transcription factor [Paenibacillus filicis]MCZ8514565.1 response regulator transcription factor [Paenibacillus filicis]